jgi:hypothetical protein
MTEAEEALLKMRRKVLWLYQEAGNQAHVGNRDTAVHYEAVAKACAEILDGLAHYVSRNPSASKSDLLSLLKVYY